MAWIKVSDHEPKLYPSEYGWLESNKVLVYTGGRQQVAFRRQIDEDCPVKWCSDCSEGWDLTADITHWMALPLPPAKDA